MILLGVAIVCASSTQRSAVGISPSSAGDAPKHVPLDAAPGVRYTSAPELLLLGLPKAGTSSLFRCLISGAFYDPVPRGYYSKEPQLFKWGGADKMMKMERNNGTYVRKPGALLMDFSTIYLAEAWWSIPKMMQIYTTREARMNLRFVLVTRDPVARALSNFCMFMPSLRGAVHRIARRPVDNDADGSQGWHASLTGLWTQANISTHQLVRAFPALDGGDGSLNRSALAHVARFQPSFPGRDRLRRMLLPWTDVCEFDSGQGWNLAAKTFEQSVRDELRWSRDPAVGCGRPPASHKEMTTPELREYVGKCYRQRDYMATANLSIPLFQLALFLREFPDSHWAFFQYEELFEAELSGGEVQRLLAANLGIQQRTPTNHSQACNFAVNSGQSYKGNRLDARLMPIGELLYPWYTEMLQLISDFRVQTAARSN